MPINEIFGMRYDIDAIIIIIIIIMVIYSTKKSIWRYKRSNKRLCEGCVDAAWRGQRSRRGVDRKRHILDGRVLRAGPTV